ncbi:50S ribosomal protein L22 [Patescibacteria group bacterium]|nr:50S ribosomal protein L22 [Patescibacteria group bacterium]
MEIKASLNNLRISPRKARLVSNLIKGMGVPKAQAQLTFLVKKPAPLILKLLNSAVANAKSNFDIQAENLYIQKIVVEAGPSLKRWLPRAMGRATPLLKRTCSIKVVLAELSPTAKKAKKTAKPEVVKPEEVLPESKKKEETVALEEKISKTKTPVSAKPYGASSESKKRIFSRQTFGNIKKMFRRKSI